MIFECYLIEGALVHLDNEGLGKKIVYLLHYVGSNLPLVETALRRSVGELKEVQ
jgi:hypothetical protein